MADETNSYCAHEDVERWTQVGDYDASSVPTLTEVYSFQAGRAAELYAILADVMGTAAPGPAAFGTTIDTGTDAGLALSAVVSQYNAIGAAIDALAAGGAGTSPGRSERINELFALWGERETPIRAAARVYQGLGGRSATHKSIGEITSASVDAREEDGLTFDGTTKF